jgi:hypothetical protein
MDHKSNIRKPSDISQEIEVLGDKISANLVDLSQNLIAICRLWDEGWTAYHDKGWDNSELRQFALKIHAEGVGPDPKNSLLRMNEEGRYKIQSTWKYMSAIAESDMFLDPDILAVCRTGNITCLYEISSLWTECKRRKNRKTPDVTLGKKRMLKFLEQNQDPTRELINAYKNELKAENASDPKITRSTMEGEDLSVATIEQLVARGETFDTILITPNDDHWAEIENSEVRDLDEKYGFAAIRNEQSTINISANGKRTALAIRLASVMGVSNPEILILTDEPIASRAIPLDQATVIISNQKLTAPSRIGKKDTSELTMDIIKREGRNLHLFADKVNDDWTVVKSAK